MRSLLYKFVLAAAFIVTTAVYWPGLSGTFLFDDYPNIVDNHDVQPHDAHLSSLVLAALSSPSSEFKRPLASLSFAANYLATGLDPYWMKLTNLIIHLLNGLLVFLLARALLQSALATAGTHNTEAITTEATPAIGEHPHGASTRTSMVAVLIAAGWMLLPINLTGVLYVVQRMESMANLFVLLGLIGYVAGRQRMLGHSYVPANATTPSIVSPWVKVWRGFCVCAISITVSTAFGVLAKETAVMLPLYAMLIEWTLFRFRSQDGTPDRRIHALFLVVLVLPMIAGLAWLLPQVLNPGYWSTRDFTLSTRLLSEARIVADYIGWTLLPTPDALSFYHDNFHISTGLITPSTTLGSIALLVVLLVLVLWLRSRWPLAALGIALFLGCQLLTSTILPLELVYEHRNYFASFGLLLAIVPMLAAPASRIAAAKNSLPYALPRYMLLAGMMLCWTMLTALTAYAWGDPLRLAADLADRAPQSPRAEYELGRTYIIYSQYDPASPFTRLAYAPLERAAALPESSILPLQALIFMNSRMHLPIKDRWWDSLITKLKARQPGVQDESSLEALTQCDREHHCDLPKQRMMQAYLAALSHPDPSARLLALYGDYAWNVLDDHDLGLRMTAAAVAAAPSEPAYHITQIRMLAALGQTEAARKAYQQLETLNIGGRLDSNLTELRALPGMRDGI